MRVEPTIDARLMVLVRPGVLRALPGTVSPVVPLNALTFSDRTPLQFSDGQYLQLAS